MPATGFDNAPIRIVENTHIFTFDPSDTNENYSDTHWTGWYAGGSDFVLRESRGSFSNWPVASVNILGDNTITVFFSAWDITFGATETIVLSDYTGTIPAITGVTQAGGNIVIPISFTADSITFNLAGMTVHDDDTYTVTVSFAADQAATAQDDEFTTNELTPVTGNVFADNGFGPDNDPDGPPLSIAEVNGSAANVGGQITLPSGALLTVNADGSFSYDPNGAFDYTPTFGSGAFNTPSGDAFSYTLAGGDGATVVFTINGVDNNDTIIGSDNNDLLTGGAGNDQLYGLDGNDFLRGNFGDDTLDGGDGFDRIGYFNGSTSGITVDLRILDAQNVGEQGFDTITNVEAVSGTVFDDSLIGNDEINWLWGSISGGGTDNNDYLDGQGGDDILTVGIGDHTIIGGNDNDTLVFTENGGPEVGITVDLFSQGGPQDTGAGSWTISGIENVSGGVENDILGGDGNANVLAGNLGSDWLIGNGGGDTLYGDGFVYVDNALVTQTVTDPGTEGGNDTLDGGGGDDILYGGGGTDVLTGGTGNDLNYGGAGDDLIRGRAGDDLIDGGDGFDRAGYYHIDELAGGVTVDLNIVGPQNTGSQGWDTLVSIEYLSGTPFADVLIGDANDNVLWGSTATIDPNSNWFSTTNNDTLDGGAGNDLLYAGIGNHKLIGGEGNDTVGFTENWGDDPAIHINLALQGAVQDTGQGLWTLSGIENLSGGNDDDELTGDNNSNILAGSFGNDVLNGSGGADSLFGDGAIDTGAPTSGPATLFPDVGADGNDVLDGGDGDDQLYGGGGNDALIGGAGDDLLDGGAGRDLANYGPAAGPVTVDLGAGTATGDGNDTLVGIEDVLGSHQGDVLIGDGDYNVLNGGGGNDLIDGAGGDDTVMGGDGDDQLYANTGNDQLIGGLGDDVLDGGADRDVADYQYASGGVTSVLYGGGFGETVGADGYDQLYNIEDLNGSAFNDILYGDEGNNMVVGNDGHDDVRGGGGDDNVLAGAGDDLLYGNGGNDYLDGGDGYDRVGYYSGATAGVTVDLNLQGVQQDTGQGWDVLVNIENVSGTRFGDTLTGDGGDNVLWGSTATLNGVVSTENNDTLSGGGGNDLLIAGIGNHVVDGGDGIDTFRFTENGVPETGITLSLLLAGQAQASGNGSWTLTGIENLSGGIGGDSLTGDGNANVLAGDLGDDTLSGGAGDDTLYGDGQIMWDDHGTGRSGPAITTADATSEYVGGVSGNDTLEGGLGDDQLWGGGGSDTASYANALGGVSAFLYNNGFGEAEGADGYDQLHDIENLTGSAFNDILSGNNQDNILSGGDGNDTLRGNAGNDQMYGGSGADFLGNGAGDDLLDGGGGNDRVSHFTGATAGVTVDLRIQGVAQDTGQGLDTLIGIEHVSGTMFGDTLTGDAGDNWIWGSPATISIGNVSTANNDTLDGGDGNDLLVVGIGNHSVTGGNGIDTVRFTENFGDDPAVTVSLALQDVAQDTGQGSWILTGIENLAGGTGNDGLTGDGNANVLAGFIGDDVLVGGGGNDFLLGDGMINVDANLVITTYFDQGTFGGNDILEGGLGNDQLYGGAGTDTASFASASGGVSAGLGAGGTGGSSGAAGNDSFNSIENLLGSTFNDQFGGNDEDNVIDGNGGHDIIVGRSGNDHLIGGDGDDYLRGDDEIAGDDIIDGGSGWDRAAFNLATGGVTIDLNIQGVAQNTGQGMDTLISIEHASGSTFNDTIIGDNGDNWLRSWGGDDVISGNGGNDLIETMPGNNIVDGGSGVDSWSFYGDGIFFASGVNVSLAQQGAAQDTGHGTMLATGFENLSGTIHADVLTGDGSANVLAGDVGNDSLHGGAGNDTLYGDGSIFVDWHGDGGSGAINYFSDITVMLGGVAGDDLLEGGLGNDTLDGAGGIDTASYANASGGVNVNLGTGTSSGADGNDTLVNVENVTGSAFNDSITGSGDSNVLDGLGGNDTISGGAGDDILNGGDGDDFLQGDFGENNLTLTGNDVMYGGNGNDLLRGGLGDDQFYGGANNDQFRGNGGVDYFDGGADDGQGVNGIGDRVSFFEQRATQGVVADLRTGIISNDGFGNVETMVGIESLGGDTAFIDTFYGNDDRNYLAGGRGDFVYGFGGDDMFQMISATAILDGGDGIDRLSLFVTATGQLLADANGDGLAEFAAAANAGFVVNLTDGTILDGYGFSGAVSGIENVDGTILADTLIGDGNINLLNGFDGDDLLEGRGGNDTLDGGNGTDTASYANASSGVTVNLFAGTATGADGDDGLSSIENLIGSAFADTLIGNGQANVLNGGDGLDTLLGFGGADTLDGGNGPDNLFGHQANDALNGGDGNDNLFGGTGDDLVDGGGGFNLASYAPNNFDPLSNGVTVDLNLQGVAQNTGQGWDTLINIQALSGTQFNDTLIGDGAVNVLIAAGTGAGAAGGNDQLFGNGGNDLLIVGSGNLLLDGGSGSDTVNFGAAGATLLNGVTVSLAVQDAAQATGSGNMTLTGIENLSGTGLSDVLTGDGGDNELSGSGGDDLLVGGAGNDSLRGDAAFTAFAAQDAGLLAPYLATDASVFAGQVVGNDTLDGGLGNDLLDGGGGTDTASYANASGSVTVTLTASGGSSSGADGADTLISIENASGGAFRDILTGNNNANVLAGGDGHDSLSGAGGNDTLQGGNGDDGLTGGAGDDIIDGGAGFDRANYNVGATAGVTVNLTLAGAQNTGQGFDTLTDVEHVVGTTFNDVITGNAADNWLWGGSLGTGVTGNDNISGGDGNDLIEVGTGNHTLNGGNGIGDTLSFFGGGTDITSTGVAFNLTTTTAQNTRQGTTTATGFENLSGSIHADMLTGNTGNNVLAGNAGNDVLTGGVGSDTLYGDGGYTTFTAGGAGTGPIRLVTDVAIEFGAVSGNDTLNGGDGDDFLYGGGGNDIMKGDKGNDTLYGGTGNDTLVGGQGNDSFVIEASSGADTISGFAHVDNIFFDASSGVTAFSQLTLTKVGGTSTLITWGNGNSILIDNMKPTDLTAADFSFASASAAMNEIPPSMRVYSASSFDTSAHDAGSNWHAPADYLMV